MAQELLVVLVCDGCMVFDGRRNTDAVETIGIPRTKVDLDICPSCRDRLEPLLDLIEKKGRPPANEKGVATRRRDTRLTPPRPAAQLSIAADGEQDWGILCAPDGYSCEWCAEQPGSGQSWGSHVVRAHPDKCKKCIVCPPISGQPRLVTNPYSHYLNHHRDLPRPAGSWKGEVTE